MTQAQLFAAVRALGLVIKRTEGGDEYRLAFPLTHYDGSRAYQMERQEAQSYYGSDPLDVLATATTMLKVERAQRIAHLRSDAWSRMDEARD